MDNERQLSAISTEIDGLHDELDRLRDQFRVSNILIILCVAARCVPTRRFFPIPQVSVMAQSGEHSIVYISCNGA